MNVCVATNSQKISHTHTCKARRKVLGIGSATSTALPIVIHWHRAKYAQLQASSSLDNIDQKQIQALLRRMMAVLPAATDGVAWGVTRSGLLARGKKSDDLQYGVADKRNQKFIVNENKLDKLPT